MSTDSLHRNAKTYKLLLVGDSCVGKTSLLIRFKDQIFLKGSYISTVGIDYKTKLVNANGRFARLQIWDTAGQEKFRSVTKSYYRDSDAVILVYDVTRMESFLHTKSWLSEIQSNAVPNTLLVLTGNKTDEEKSRVVSTRDGECLAKETDALFWETSAKTGYNVDSMFHSIAEQLTLDSTQSSPTDKNGVSLKSVRESLVEEGANTANSSSALLSQLTRCCNWS